MQVTNYIKNTIRYFFIHKFIIERSNTAVQRRREE